MNISLPVIECPGIISSIDSGDNLEFDLTTGKITDITKGIILEGSPMPDFLLKMMQAGGLVPFLKAKLK